MQQVLKRTSNLTQRLVRKWKKLWRPNPISARRTSKSLLENDGLRVFATTVLRGSTNENLTGYLIEIDWSSGSVERRVPIPLDTGHPFWNARGGNRGGRGVCVHEDVLYVATSMSVLKYDKNLKPIGEVTHPHLAGLHEIYVDDSGIWFTSTLHDLVLKTNFEGKLIDEWWGSESSVLQEYFNFSSRNYNLNLDFPAESFEEKYEEYCSEERLHINTVKVIGDEVYVLSNNKGALIRIRPTPEKVIIHDRQLESPHNSVIYPSGKVLVNNTKKKSICIYSLETGKLNRVLRTSLSHTNGSSKQFAKAGWQRGLTAIDEDVCLVGTSPAAIFEVDVERALIGRVVTIDDDVRHCIHGLTAVRNF